MLRRLFFQNRKFVFDRIRHALLTCPAVMINQKIARETGEPNSEGALARAERIQAAEDAQEDVLGEVLRLVIPARKPITKPIDTSRIRLDEVFPSALLAGQAPFNQAEFFVQSAIRPKRTGMVPAPQPAFGV